MQNSVWSNNTKMPEFKSLNQDIQTDILIIGGGLCGLLCAYYLDSMGADYILVEGNKIASGVTKNTTAKITAQHGLIYSKLMKSYSFDTAQMYLYANLNALTEYKNLCKNINCDFEVKDAFTYTMTDRNKIEDEVSAVNKLGFKADFCDETELPFKTQGAIRFKDQAQFHPLKFLSAITKQLKIYENTFVNEITPHSVITNNHKIKADKIIVTSHFPFINKHGSYFLKLYQHRSYVSALENAATLKGMYVDEDKTGMSFRSYKNLLFISGSGHRTGKNSRAWNALKDFAGEYYPNSVIKYRWAAQDCMSLDSIPYIGKYSNRTPNLYVATGFNKWGITSSMVAARILVDEVSGKKNEFSKAFSPQRSMLKPQLLVNGFEAITNLLTPTTKRCPHLGCALKWNKAEHTWDCPCHGSRFEHNGTLIDNPATGDAKSVKKTQNL